MDSTSCGESVVYELQRNNKAAIKMTQHKVYKRKNILFLKYLLHVIVFATVSVAEV